MTLVSENASFRGETLKHDTPRRWWSTSRARSPAFTDR